jgi:uncharacterized protein (DUF849 family)
MTRNDLRMGDDGPLLLQAALNGARTTADHLRLPISTEELVRDAVACVAAGARAVHLHPRDRDGRESLDPAVVNGVAAAVRAAAGVPVSVTTGAWIEPDVERRVAAIRGWHAPDSASVNVGEPGAAAVMEALLERGIGVEPGVSTVAEVEGLAASGLGDRCLRILIEPVDLAPAETVAVVDEIHAALDRHGLAAPRLQHGFEETTWLLLADAVARRVATRIGLEDTTVGPDGEPVAGNAALVRLARAAGAGGPPL